MPVFHGSYPPSTKNVRGCMPFGESLTNAPICVYLDPSENVACGNAAGQTDFLEPRYSHSSGCRW